jgi:hypothetical protein
MGMFKLLCKQAYCVVQALEVATEHARTFARNFWLMAVFLTFPGWWPARKFPLSDWQKFWPSPELWLKSSGAIDAQLLAIHKQLCVISCTALT